MWAYIYFSIVGMCER